MNGTPNYPFEDLSKREMQVLQGLTNGMAREEIAAELEISVHTYDWYRKSIRQKLRIKNQFDWGVVLTRFNQYKKSTISNFNNPKL